MNSPKKKYVIYTAIVGNYDDVPTYSVVDDRFDYILYSDSIVAGKVGIWDVRPIPCTCETKAKTSRWVKMHPEELLPEYEASLWLDACVEIKSSYVYERFISLLESSCLISSNPNPDVICVYQEMCSMLYLHWEHDKKIIEWGRYLRREKYPRWSGSFECWMIFRKHNDSKIRTFDSKWWWCLENYARRDQFSFPYLLWKLNIEAVPFLPSGIDIRHNEYLDWNEHANAGKKAVEGKSCHLIRYYRKHVDERVRIENILYWIYGREYPYSWLYFIGLFFKAKHVIFRCFGRKNNSDYLAEVERMREQNFGQKKY